MKQKEMNSTARKNAYLKYIRKYPLYSTLMVLKDYEEQELFMECFYIKKALDEYKSEKSKSKNYDKVFNSNIFLPTKLEVYESKEFQNILRNHKVKINKKSARSKADQIKINLPIK